jgi:transposase-like protein
MKRSRYSDEQISYALRQAEGGTAIADVCRGLGISEATFYVWKKKYANLGGTEIRSAIGCCRTTAVETLMPATNSMPMK